MPLSERENDSNPKRLFWEELREKVKELNLKPKKVLIILLGLALISLLGYGIYSYWYWNIKSYQPSLSDTKTDSKKISQSARPSKEGTVASPLNGLLYTEEGAKVWQERRPMAVVVNNHFEARPQTGLSEADLVYEAVAEGGITRFLAIFHSRSPEKVGPVRSARVYFADWAREYDAWLAHWGAAQVDPNNPAVSNPQADAFARMRTVFVPSIDQMAVGASAFWREPKAGLATEHTGYTSVPKLYQTGYRLYPDQEREFREIKPWLFKDDLPEEKRPEKQSLSFNFWDDPNYEVLWEYERGENNYSRSQGGKPHLDAGTGGPLTAKNVVIIFMPETRLFDKKAHLLYGTIGSGKATVFLDGKTIKGRWSRPTVEGRTRFYGPNEEEIAFNRGLTWLEILPLDQEVIIK